MARAPQPRGRTGLASVGMCYVRDLRHSLMPLALFSGLAMLLTWPQPARFDSIPDQTDAYFNLWRLGWIAHELPGHPTGLFDGNIFHPERWTLAYSDAVLVEGVMTLPVIRAGVPIVYAYNGLVLTSFVLSGLTMFVLVRRLFADDTAAVLAGVIFAFAPYRFDHYHHLELLCAWWMPLAFWMMHRTITSGRLRDGVWLGVLLALQALSSVYYGVYLVTLLPALVVPLWLGLSADERRRATAALGAALVVFVVVVAPLMLPYLYARDTVGEREVGNALLYGAGPRHYLASMPDNLLTGGLTGSLGRHEKFLTPGLTAIALTVVALWPPIGRRTAAYGLLLGVSILLSAGTPGMLFDVLQEYVPVYRGLRVPARAGQLALAAFAVLAAVGLIRCRAWMAARGWPARWVVVTLVLMAGAEYVRRPATLVPVETNAPPVYAWLRTQPVGIVAEFPMPTVETMPLHEGRFQYLSTFHWRPLINGYSGSWSSQHTSRLASLEAFPNPEALSTLREAGVTYVIVHERHYEAETFERVMAGLDASIGVEPLQRLGPVSARTLVYRLHGTDAADLGDAVVGPDPQSIPGMPGGNLTAAAASGVQDPGRR